MSDEMSRKAWKKFLVSLTELELRTVYDTSNAFDPIIWARIEHKMHLAGFDENWFNKAVPKPRLVGIELNPGPTVFSKLNKKKNKAKQTVITEKVTKVKQPRQSIARLMLHTQGTKNSRSSTSASLRNDYINTLRDPWEYGPIELGYNTFQTTELATAYLRGSLTVNADGSFAMFMSPSALSMFSYNVAGATTATWSTINSTNYAAVSTQIPQSRVVSGGLRVYCLFPETSASGILYSTSDVSSTYNTLITNTPTTISALSGAEMSIGSSGSRVVMLPIDNDSYSFFSGPTNAYSGGALPYHPSLLISGLGFPTGTKIFYESILNLEGLPAAGASTVGTDPNQTNNSQVLVGSYPTPQSLYNSVRNAIGNAVTIDAALGLAGTIATATGNPNIAAGIGLARSTFASGRHMRTAMVAGQNSNRQGRQTTLIAEEVKDEEAYTAARRLLR